MREMKFSSEKFFKIAAGTLAAGTIFFAGTTKNFAQEIAAGTQNLAAKNAISGEEFDRNFVKKTFLLANSADHESLEIAEFYMKKRGIPAENLIAFPMPKKETISWLEFSTKIHEPLLKILVERKLVAGTISEKRDPAARRILMLPERVAISDGAGTKIAFLISCRGVPLRIENEKILVPEELHEAKNNPAATNAAAVDSELALIALPSTPVNGFVHSPLFKKPQKFEPGIEYFFIKTARLDAPNALEARMIVESALKAEKNGLIGRAYFDVGGPFQLGNDWISSCHEIAKKLGFDTSLDSEKSLFPPTKRYDAPAIYFGWYSQKVGGFFADKNFAFPPGAIAAHLHSFSAVTLRDENVWAPKIIASGAAATLGNVFEPYLNFSHHFDFFMEALATGKCAGEAAAIANPVLSWQTIFVGDPLYRPFKKTFSEQVLEATERPSKLSPYVFLRAANLTEIVADSVPAEKKSELPAVSSEKILKEAARISPSLVLNFEVFRREILATNAFPKLENLRINFAEENAGLICEIADFFEKRGNGEAAISIFKRLLEENPIAGTARNEILKAALDCAKRNFTPPELLISWEKELGTAEK